MGPLLTICVFALSAFGMVRSSVFDLRARSGSAAIHDSAKKNMSQISSVILKRSELGKDSLIGSLNEGAHLHPDSRADAVAGTNNIHHHEGKILKKRLRRRRRRDLKEDKPEHRVIKRDNAEEADLPELQQQQQVDQQEFADQSGDGLSSGNQRNIDENPESDQAGDDVDAVGRRAYRLKRRRKHLRKIPEEQQLVDDSAEAAVDGQENAAAYDTNPEGSRIRRAGYQYENYEAAEARDASGSDESNQVGKRNIYEDPDEDEEYYDQDEGDSEFASYGGSYSNLKDSYEK